MAGPLEPRVVALQPPQVVEPVRDTSRWADGDLIFVPGLGWQGYKDGAWHGLLYGASDAAQAFPDVLPPVIDPIDVSASLAALGGRVGFLEDERWVPALMLMGG